MTVPYEKMDPECRRLCAALNLFEGVRTRYSCAGHGQGFTVTVRITGKGETWGYDDCAGRRVRLASHHSGDMFYRVLSDALGQARASWTYRHEFKTEQGKKRYYLTMESWSKAMSDGSAEADRIAMQLEAIAADPDKCRWYSVKARASEVTK